MGLDLVREVRGAMTHFNQLTPELVAAYAEDNLTYDQLADAMAKYDLDIQKVVLDETRTFQNVFYADYENGWYGELYLRRKLDDYLRHLAARMKKQGEKNANLQNKDMDALDRVRFNGLDYRLLRTPYARRLPLVAGGLLEEKLEEVIQQMNDGSLEAILNGNG